MSYHHRKINVLVVVDTESTLAKGTVAPYVFLIDDQGAFGSSGEGTSNLTTFVHPTDQIFVRITGILPDVDPEITAFNRVSGEKIFDPRYDESKDCWCGTVDGTGTEAYNWTITIQGNNYSWDPYLKSVNP